MCGIAGLISSESSLDLQLLRQMLASLSHRGPDSQGVLYRTRAGDVRIATGVPEDVSEAQLALGHQRLAIIDLSETGFQPMSTPDGQYHIVYNGEIYNYRELRGQLKSLGWCFRSTSDTEVLLTAYAQWGPAAFTRCIGMFALAILDARRRALLLARDFFGIKPLYYASWRDGVAFASEIGPLLTLPGVAREIEPERLLAYLRDGQTDETPRTLLRSVRQVPAAHWLEWSVDKLQPTEPVRYWSLPRDRLSRDDLSLQDAAQHVREKFLHSVELHLRSDVPVGVALSGGIDSSSILAAVRHLAGSAQELHAFSYVADDPRLSEETWIDMVAATSRATVHKVSPSAGDLARDFHRLARAQGEPFGSTSIYAQYRVFEAAQRAGVKVMLDGQGADELLAGYRGYHSVRLVSLVRQRRWREAKDFHRRASTWTGSTSTWLTLRATAHFLPHQLQAVGRRLIGGDAFPRWLNAAWFAERGVWQEPRPLDARSLHDALVDSLTTSSLPALLRYEDRNSMAFSIESRVPFLTPDLAQLLLSLPEEYLIAPDGTSKAVFRLAMRGLVPDPILDRRDKVGFETSERDWLVHLRPWVEGLLYEAAEVVPAFNPEALRHAWRTRIDGRRMLRSTNSPIWRCINVIRWSTALEVAFT